MEQDISAERSSDKLSSTALWISIIVFVLITLWIILSFDNQDDQDKKKIDTPDVQGVMKT